MRVPGKIALAMLMSMLLGASASTASAEPLSMTFTEARANVGEQLDDDPLFEAPDTAPFQAEIDPGSGEITAGALTVPQFSTFITDPIEADVTVDFDIGPIDGSFDQATGALTLSGEAGGTLTSEGPDFEGEECTVSTDPAVLTLTTAGNSGGASPRSGAPFATGLTGAGAIAGEWTGMHATPVSPGDIDNVDFCNNVEGEIGGPGGVWLEQEGDGEPSPPSDGDEDTPTRRPTPPAPPPVGPPIATGSCVVPKLAGKRPARARRALRRAGCRPGRAWMPRRLKRRLRRHAKLRRRLVVKASRPRAGRTRPAGARVHLRLGVKPRKARLGRGSKVRDCDITFDGPGPADWRKHSLSIGPFGLDGPGGAPDFDKGAFDGGLLTVKTPTMVAGHRPVTVSVPEAQRHRVGILGVHPRPAYASVTYVPCDDKPRTVFAAGFLLRDRRPVTLLVQVGDGPARRLRVSG